MKNELLVHKHLIIRAEALRPPMEEKQLEEWFLKFVESINMKYLWVLMLNTVTCLVTEVLLLLLL
jgi:hypothetical protein